MPITSFPRRLHVSMTTTYCLKKPQAIFYTTTSSLLKLANCSTHGGETWCACVLHRFHDNYDKNSLRHLSSKIFLHSSNLLTLDPGDLKSRNFIGPIFCLKLIISTRLACSCTALKQPQFSFVPCFRYLSHVKFNWKNA